MSLVTLAQARAHCRVDPDYPAEQLAGYIAGASAAAQDYLNRAVFPDTESLQAARAGYSLAVGGAADARRTALTAADAIAGYEARCAAKRIAEVVHEEALRAADRALHGIVVNDAIQSAVLLTVGHLFANRSGVVIGASSIELDLGVKALLRPHRRVMMP